MQMRPSRVLQKLRAGELASCVKMNLADPRSTEIAAICGFDCVWLDMEHVPTDWVTIENQIRAAKAYNVDTMVRVSRGPYSDYIQPLEADASGIMVPHIMSTDDARMVVHQTRFHPIGMRAIDGGNQDGAYCLVDFKEYIKTANEQRFIVVQIEDTEPLEDLEDIAKIDGIDMLFFGPGDFSQSLGTPGEFDNPMIAETRKRVAEVAKANGKYAGTTCGVGKIQEYYDMGYQFISSGADVLGLGEYYGKIADCFKAIK